MVMKHTKYCPRRSRGWMVLMLLLHPYGYEAHEVLSAAFTRVDGISLLYPYGYEAREVLSAAFTRVDDNYYHYYIPMVMKLHEVLSTNCSRG